jgi:hypothetical protein
MMCNLFVLYLSIASDLISGCSHLQLPLDCRKNDAEIDGIHLRLNLSNVTKYGQVPNLYDMTLNT